MVTIPFLVAAAVVVVALLGVAIARYVQRERTAAPPPPQRSYELEARIKTVLTGPRQKYGEIFTTYSVWKSESETRLELVAGEPWKKLNEFTRALVVRYLWRVLESLAGGAVVIVDDPTQVWNEEIDSGFRDQGFDWKTFGSGPQFINES
jgi:hypothetical protein